MTLDRVEGIIPDRHLLSSDLHTQGNRRYFISHLPDEILAEIFIGCARDYHRCAYRASSPEPVPCWVNVSYVCRRWRNVALDCATLWSNIFVTSQRWTEEQLARSKQSSLTLYLKPMYVEDDIKWLNSWVQVLDHVERIQELCLDFPESCIHQVLSKLSSRAPRLRNLELSMHDHWHWLIPQEWPSVLFDGDTPALHTLELSACVVPLQSFKLNNLTTLRLHSFPTAPAQQITEEFLSTLKCMQGLGHLYLEHVLSSATNFLSSATFNRFERIHLPHLSRLLIAGPLSAVVVLLSCTKIPLETEIRLRCNSETGYSLDNYGLLSSFLAQRYNTTQGQGHSGSTIRSMVISLTEEGLCPGLAFSTSKDVYRYFIPLSTEAWGRNTPLQIVLPVCYSTNDRDHIVSNICCAMSSTSVECLYVSHPPFSAVFWRTVLSHLAGVQLIELDSGNMPDLSVLSAPVSGSAARDDTVAENQVEDRGQGRMLVPQLAHLGLLGIMFAPADGLAFGPGQALGLREPAMSRTSLITALATRVGASGRVSFAECQIGEGDRFSFVASWGDGPVRVTRAARRVSRRQG